MDILLQNYTTNFKRITFLYFIHYIKMEGKSLLNMPPFQYYLRKFRYLLDCGTSCLKVKVAALCLTPCGPVDCSPPGASVHGIFQARILEQVAISYSRRSSQLPGIEPRSLALAGRLFTTTPYKPTQTAL